MTFAKIITISDIQTSDLLYFDPALKDSCYKFCRDRDIDCLPALDDQQIIYLRDESTLSFRKEGITEDRKVAGFTNIFDEQMLKHFSKHPLLMVYSNMTLSGVVHFSDYNSSVVSLYLYELFLAYEKNLRALLVKHKLNNADMLAYFEMKKSKAKKEKDTRFYEDKIRAYNENLSKNEKLQQFESFYLKDLIALANNRRITSLSDKVFELRNMVMHAHEFVNMEDPNTDDLIYNSETFKKFFELALILHKDYKRVSNHLAFIS
jgi:hypothetical protein